MDQRCGLFRVFGKSVRTYSLPFWHGRPLEKHCPSKKAQRMSTRMFALLQNNIFLRAQTPHGQSTCSCGCASWAETHFGRVIARRRHLKLYMALVNANVCIALCRFFFSVHTHVFFNHREHTRSLFAPMHVHHVFPVNAVGAVRALALDCITCDFLD